MVARPARRARSAMGGRSPRKTSPFETRQSAGARTNCLQVLLAVVGCNRREAGEAERPPSLARPILVANFRTHYQDMSLLSPSGYLLVRQTGDAMRIRGKLAGLLLTAAVACSVAVASPAHAAGPYTTGGAQRMCTDTTNSGCAPIGSWGNGTPVTMICWFDEVRRDVGAYASYRWFYVIGPNNMKGWVHASWIPQTVQAAVPYCPGNWPGVMASSWAARHLNATSPTAAEASQIGNTTGMWSGWCAGFVWDAYVFGAYRSSSARNQYVAYANAA
jgi:hypothetical protein